MRFFFLYFFFFADTVRCIHWFNDNWGPQIRVSARRDDPLQTERSPPLDRRDHKVFNLDFAFYLLPLSKTTYRQPSGSKTIASSRTVEARVFLQQEKSGFKSRKCGITSVMTN